MILNFIPDFKKSLQLFSVQVMKKWIDRCILKNFGVLFVLVLLLFLKFEQCFHMACEVKNYPLKGHSEEELETLEKVLRLKKIETADFKVQSLWSTA